MIKRICYEEDIITGAKCDLFEGHELPHRSVYHDIEFWWTPNDVIGKDILKSIDEIIARQEKEENA